MCIILKITQNIRREVGQVLQDKDNKKTDDRRSIFYELRDNPNLPPSEKSLSRLEQEGTLLVMAGKAVEGSELSNAH